MVQALLFTLNIAHVLTVLVGSLRKSLLTLLCGVSLLNSLRTLYLSQDRVVLLMKSTLRKVPAPALAISFEEGVSTLLWHRNR